MSFASYNIPPPHLVFRWAWETGEVWARRWQCSLAAIDARKHGKPVHYCSTRVYLKVGRCARAACSTSSLRVQLRILHQAFAPDKSQVAGEWQVVRRERGWVGHEVGTHRVAFGANHVPPMRPGHRHTCTPKSVHMYTPNSSIRCDEIGAVNKRDYR